MSNVNPIDDEKVRTAREPLPPSAPPPDSCLLPSADEAEILAHLSRERPDLVGPFLAHLDGGRRGILHRLLQAMIRENIAGLADRAFWPEGDRTLQVPLPGGGILRAPVVRRLSLGRLDFGAEVVLRER